MSFEGFELSQVEVPEASLRVRHGGSGPPLLLLHGYPETHMMWGAVAGELAKDFKVVCPDLRGYGGSSKPISSHDHETSSKRALARDAVELMKHFGYERFAVAGHDRGGRVGYRLALDYPAAVSRLSVIDIIPTGEVWARADRRFALRYWHWPFLAQPHPIPENLIARDPEFFFFEAQFNGVLTTFDQAALHDYREAARQPDVIHAICEDYRAGARYDRELDLVDKLSGRKIGCPVQVLWGARGALAAWYDTLAIWREWADDVQGAVVDCGHFIPEEKPAETLALLKAFFS